MKKTYNYMIFLDALNKYTNEKFEWVSEHEIFRSPNFEVFEDGVGGFSLDQYKLDLKTGVSDGFPLLQSETLADVIDAINEENKSC